MVPAVFGAAWLN